MRTNLRPHPKRRQAQNIMFCADLCIRRYTYHLLRFACASVLATKTSPVLRSNEMAERSTIAKCFTATRRALVRDGVALDGGCLEASVELLCCLRATGERASLIRRELPRGQGGHWTVETANGEVDPTIGFWRTGRPRGVPRGALYTITPASPHHRWRRTSVDEKRALQIGLGRNPPASCKV